MYLPIYLNISRKPFVRLVGGWWVHAPPWGIPWGRRLVPRSAQGSEERLRASIWLASGSFLEPAVGTKGANTDHKSVEKNITSENELTERPRSEGGVCLISKFIKIETKTIVISK